MTSPGDTTIISAPDPYRLDHSVLPRRYDVELTPDLDAATFAGRVVISLDVQEPVARITLNAIELDIAECSVNGIASAFTLDEPTERLVVSPAAPVPAGPATLEISFTGILNDKLRGFYRSTFADADGNQHVIATTQMQATDCRRAFPCWDEPEFKAVFAITLVIDRRPRRCVQRPPSSTASHSTTASTSCASPTRW